MKKFKYPMRYMPVTATILVFFLVYLVGIVCFYNDNFGSAGNFLNFFKARPFLGIAAVGTALVILSGGIDLSVGSVIAFTSILIAKLIASGCNAFLVAIFALVIGILFGMLQGWLIHSFSLPPFLVTLAGMFLIRGCGFLISEVQIGEKDIGGDPVISFFQEKLSIPLSGGLDITFEVVIHILILIAAIVFSLCTRAGRRIYAVGDNELAATLMGIPVGRTKIMTYSIAGFCSALGGVAYVFAKSQGDPADCVGWEMDAIAAVVIGGTLLTGGVGYVFGSLFGVLILALIQKLVEFSNIDASWTRIIVGLLMLAFIFMQNLITKVSKSKSKSH